ncbi:SPRY domain-containing SOCS box protein 3-like [Condylostylus longicornis]|uniref:SPRY domain-containing SOCS box protein 3-like n=1 Tax=Condylostylus longicornis TaxID=2530218 RepID=UPI00244DA500|nr:SPRY domain-containing SOCS box protein 3-like [Condylostylus longicornis]
MQIDDLHAANIFPNFLTLPFCDCDFPRNIDVLNSKNIHELCKCKCVEDGYLKGSKEWVWHKESAHPDSYVNKGDITFHPIYSQGTAFVRGEKKLELKMIHYWEIQIITSPSGTDQMFGIGTDKLKFDEYRYKFVSGLGRNKQSWGFSYRGVKTHNGIAVNYGKRITQGCVVGVYLDLFHGYLEFYLNRKPLGIAFKNIPLDPSTNIYPIVCSTSSRCAIRLLNSTSQPVSLQFQTMRIISKQPDSLSEIKKFPGLKPLLNKYWFLISSTKYSHRSRKNELPLDDEVVLSKRARKSKPKSVEDDFNIGIYENIHRVPLITSEDDDDSSDNGMFLLL